MRTQAIADKLSHIEGGGTGIVPYGNCWALTLFGVVLPIFTRIGSRSFPVAVYLIMPSMFAS